MGDGQWAMGVRFEFINVVADSMESVCAVGADGAGLCREIITDWNGRNPLNHPDGKAETGDRDGRDGSDFGDSRVSSSYFNTARQLTLWNTDTRSPGKFERPRPTGVVCELGQICLALESNFG